MLKQKKRKKEEDKGKTMKDTGNQTPGFKYACNSTLKKNYISHSALKFLLLQ